MNRNPEISPDDLRIGFQRDFAPPMMEPIARIRIGLREIEPTIRRRVDVRLSSTQLALHDIIQVTFGWTGSHLFEFRVGDRVYGEPVPEDESCKRKVCKAADIRLKTLIGRGVERFLYVYDFGDSRARAR